MEPGYGALNYHYLEVHGVVISGGISRATIVITHIRGLIPTLITTPKPKNPIEPFKGTLKGTP